MLIYLHHRDHGDSSKYLCGKYCRYRADCRRRKLRGAQRLQCNLVPMQHTFCQLPSVLHYPRRVFKEGGSFELVGKKKNLLEEGEAAHNKEVVFCP